MCKESWDEINSIIEGKESNRTVHMGELSSEKLKKIRFLLAETEDFKLQDTLRKDGVRFAEYLKAKYPLLSDNSCSILEERARFMDR